MKTRYEVKPVGKGFKVWDTKDKGWITKYCPKDVADEVCSDFNKMENKDYSPIGFPDFSKRT